ncbi:MAG: hypothetical protein IJ950_01560 [Helicobacter sp.]|nr:hypothetical protein [Helicobacter sp.]
MDFIINLGSSLGGVIGGWLVTHFYHKKAQKESHKQHILAKLEKLMEAIYYAYKVKAKARKTKLQDISYINIRSQKGLLGQDLVFDLEDILFKNLDSREETIVAVKKAFQKHFPTYF